jgi:RNA polymerase sigma factor (TIGR02999 family)
MAGDDRDISAILLDHRRGVPGALDALFERVYADLRRMARGQLGRHAARPLDTTSLVHELYLKLSDQSALDVQDRGHFMGVAGRAMRQVIVDFARRVNRRKRGGGQAHVTLDPEEHGLATDALSVLAIDEALERLDAVDPRLTRLVELRFFAGFSEAEAAEALGVSLRTAQRDWLRAKALLRELLDRRAGSDPA